MHNSVNADNGRFHAAGRAKQLALGLLLVHDALRHFTAVEKAPSHPVFRGVRL